MFAPKCNSQVLYVHEAFNNYLSSTTANDLNKRVFETLPKYLKNLSKKASWMFQRMKTEASKLTTQLKQLETRRAIKPQQKKINAVLNLLQSISFYNNH